MHLLHRSSMFSGGDGGSRALRRVGSFPRAPPPAPMRHITLSRSESIKKKSGAAKRSKRARLRAGLAAALHELRLSAGGGRKHGARGQGAGASATDVNASGAARLRLRLRLRAGDDVRGRGACCAAGADPAPLHVSVGCGADEAQQQASRGIGGLGGVVACGGRRRVKDAAAGRWPLLLVVAVLALACVVALGRAPAVCCCTCAAWLCRGPLPLCCGAASTGGRRHRSSEPCASSSVVQ